MPNTIASNPSYAVFRIVNDQYQWWTGNLFDPNFENAQIFEHDFKHLADIVVNFFANTQLMEIDNT